MMGIATAPTPFIKWNAFAQIMLFSLVSGLGIVGLVSLGTLSLARARDRATSTLTRRANSLVVALCALATLSVIAWGLYLISHKG